MSGVLRDSLVRMMPRLAAEEDLRHATVVAVGTGSLKQRDAARWQRARLKEANPGRRRRAATREELKAALGGIGLNVIDQRSGGDAA